MESKLKEVRFDQYCKTCKNHDTPEDMDPCDECLYYPSNEDSHKPVNWKPIEGRNKSIEFPNWCPWCRYEKVPDYEQPCCECFTHIDDDKEEPYNFMPKKGESNEKT